MINKEQKRFGELDALRGIAALMVVFFHFTMNYNALFKFGVAGVDLFFIISGFVIFMSINNTKTAKDFIISRVSRLYPTYWTCVTFTFICIIFYHLLENKIFSNAIFIKYLGNLTMFQKYLRMSDMDDSYWTMIIEMLFYIFILLLFSLKILRHIKFIGFSLCLIVTFFTYFFYYTFSVVNIIIRGIPLFQFIPLFFAGIIFYDIYTNKKKLFLNYSIIIFCFCCQLILFPYAGGSHRFISFYEYLGMLCLFFSLFIAFVNNKLQFIVNKVSLYFGKISFALYLIHQSISTNFIIPFLTEKLNLNFWIAITLINLPIVVGIATFITYKIELPYSRKLKEILQSFYLKKTFAKIKG
jgi:peptidoglycan/LPS O-acetylase OafA/YrhL